MAEPVGASRDGVRGGRSGRAGGRRDLSPTPRTAAAGRGAVLGGVAALGLACLLASAGSTAQDWRLASPDHQWDFPRDHWSHPGYRTEWWYLTGRLQTEGADARRFGFQFTLFRVGLLPQGPALGSDWAAGDAVMGHASLIDLDRGDHRFSELLHRAVPALGGFPGCPGEPRPGDLLAWARAPAGTDTTWTLRWNGDAFDLHARDDALGIRLDLSTSPERPLVLQGPNGYSRKGHGSGAASLYYSFTRLRTRGRVTLDGRTWPVSGVSWMDKEFGSGVLAEHQSGWDWFSLRLEDGRDVMLYLLRDQENRVDYARGTLVSAGGAVRILEEGDFRVRSTENWRSPVTKAVYPSRWEISIPDAAPPIEVVVVPEAPDQENRGRLAGGLFYWEGAVAVRARNGAACGEGYVELTGYGTRNRPAL